MSKLYLAFLAISLFMLGWVSSKSDSKNDLVRCERCVQMMNNPLWNVRCCVPDLPDERFEEGYSCYNQ